jgi:hypothetical protein
VVRDCRSPGCLNVIVTGKWHSQNHNKFVAKHTQDVAYVVCSTITESLHDADMWMTITHKTFSYCTVLGFHSVNTDFFFLKSPVFPSSLLVMLHKSWFHPVQFQKLKRILNTWISDLSTETKIFLSVPGKPENAYPCMISNLSFQPTWDSEPGYLGFALNALLWPLLGSGGGETSSSLLLLLLPLKWRVLCKNLSAFLWMRIVCSFHYCMSQRVLWFAKKLPRLALDCHVHLAWTTLRSVLIHISLSWVSELADTFRTGKKPVFVMPLTTLLRKWTQLFVLRWQSVDLRRGDELCRHPLKLESEKWMSIVQVVFSIYFLISCQYCHMSMTRHRVWTDNWVYWTLATRNYNTTVNQHI